MTTQAVLDYQVVQTGPSSAAALEGLLESVPVPLTYLHTIGVRLISDVITAGPPVRRRLTLGLVPSASATATAQLFPGEPSGSRVKSFTVTAPGADYVASPIVRAPGGTVPSPVATGRGLLKVVSAAIQAGGASYAASTKAVFYGGLPAYTKIPPAIQPGQTDGNPAQPLTTQAFLRVLSIAVTAQGANYVQAQVALAGGLAPAPYGVAATASAVIRGGKIVAIQVLTTGDYYVTTPTVTITDPTGSGSGATAAVSDMIEGSTLHLAGQPATATFTIAGGVITGVTLVDGGEGYTSPPTLFAVDPTGAGVTAAFTVSMGLGSVEVLQPGFGFSEAPNVTPIPLFKALFPDGTDQAAPFVDMMTPALSSAVRGRVQALYPVIT